MVYPTSIPPYNKFRLPTPDAVNVGNRSILAIDTPDDLIPYILGAISIIQDINAWEDVGVLSPQDMTDLTNNEIIIMSICDAISDCIKNNPGTRDSLADYLESNGNGTIDSSRVPSDDPSNIISLSGCSNDEIYGAVVAIVDYVNQLSLDMMEIASENIDRLLIAIRMFDYIPVIGDAPILDDGNDFVDQLIQAGISAYLGGYTVQVRQDLICSIYCKAQVSCSITAADIIASIANIGGIPVSPGDSFEIILRAIAGTLVGTAFAMAVNAVVVSALSVGSAVAGIVGLPDLQKIAGSGNPDSDWNLFCVPCPQSWCFEWVPPSPPVDWVNVIGAASASGGILPFVDYPQSDDYLRGVDIVLTQAMTIESVEIEYDLLKGVYQDPNYSALFGLTNNGFIFSVAPSLLSPGSNQVYSWFGSESVTSLRIALRSDVATTPGARSGSGGIRRITLRGSGANPFGSTNCP